MNAEREKTAGQMAYEAYVGVVTHGRGHKPATWDALPQKQRDGWEAAARESHDAPCLLPDDPWCCQKCGSIKVEIAQWRDANTDELFNEGEDGPVDYCFCHTCEGECDIEKQSEQLKRIIDCVGCTVCDVEAGKPCEDVNGNEWGLVHDERRAEAS